MENYEILDAAFCPNVRRTGEPSGFPELQCGCNRPEGQIDCRAMSCHRVPCNNVLDVKSPAERLSRK